ncbi:glycosyltransferase [Saccharicrinis sp. FJH62]|uniref:glycosyltransferase n=1 Tax=Saccharicrinis sp. FJH62 TaxID=3344657 RepID=UPI0035D41025
MHIYEQYLKKHNIPGQFVSGWHKSVSIIIVIPCYNEPEIKHTLDSLQKCTLPETHIEVIILINSGELTPNHIISQNRETYSMILQEFPFDPDKNLNFKPWIIEGIRKKHAGAGYARKLAMDMAVSTFNGMGNENGLIVSLDADTLVEPNYLTELFNVYSDPEIQGGTIHFEHPVTDSDEPENQAILLYELHLRYYHNALKEIGFPYFYYTIGSAFFIRALEYARHGGMNRKQGGEDFYFLHKVLPHINKKILTSTKVIPSSRISDRVPFGTGPKIRQYLETGEMLTYCMEAFTSLQNFFSLKEKLFETGINQIQGFINAVPEPLYTFLIEFNAEEKLMELNQNTANIQTFTKRFFDLFNAFFIVKYLNESHLQYFNMKNVWPEVSDFFKKHFHIVSGSPYDLLNQIRQSDIKTTEK